MLHVTTSITIFIHFIQTIIIIAKLSQNCSEYVPRTCVVSTGRQLIKDNYVRILPFDVARSLADRIIRSAVGSVKVRGKGTIIIW